MEVPEDYVCEHGMPKPWATCIDCMMLPPAEQPTPPKPPPPPAPEPKKRASRARSTGGSSGPSKPRAPRQPKPSTRLPRHMDDALPELFGALDLAYEVPEENVYHHLKGPDAAWLAISSMPKELRAGGWVYLQVDRDLVARAAVRGIGFRDRRWSQEPSERTADLGPGPTIELRPDSWERIRIDLGPEGDVAVSGYRYVTTGDDGEVRVAFDDADADEAESAGDAGPA